jgi:DNA repair protein RadC
MEQEKMKPEWCQVAEVELVYRTKVKPSQRPKITTTVDAYEVLQKIWNRDKIELVEEFKVLLLNRSNKVLGVLDASSGGITGTVADPRIILAAAIKASAVGIILSHNHPSGSLKPSRADEDLTVKIKEAARYLDMTVLDHIIITSEGYFSFADEGLL